MTNPQLEKQWCAPVWKGLVMDQDAKHYRQMKNALWLYLYLLLNANRRTGVLMRKIHTVSRDMGVTRDTTIRWLNVLRTNGYIVTVNTGRSLTIQVTHWKPLAGVATIQTQRSGSRRRRDWKFPTPFEPPVSLIPVQNDRQSSIAAASNETKIQIVLHNDLRRGRADDPVAGFTRIGEYAWRERLANDLAKALNDSAGIELYRSYCARYPERLLRKVLAEVQEVPTTRITKSRGALFNYLVQHYVKGTNDHSGR